jgi:hypothetical protein
LPPSPGGTRPQAFPDWAELKAAYRFFGQRGVSFERVLTPHLEHTRQACRQAGEYLLIEDTTLLEYSHHPATEDLGVIGDGCGRGFELHSALAVRIESWTLAQRPEGVVVGLFAQQCRIPRPAPEGETPDSVFAGPANRRPGQQGSSPLAVIPAAASGFMWRIGNRIFTNRCNFASDTEWTS